MMIKIKLNLQGKVDDSYQVMIGRNLWAAIAKDLAENPPGKKCVVITDSMVIDLYGEKILSALCDAGIDACALYFSAGEASKNPKTWLGLAHEMLRLGYGRDSFIIALGGGVVGDVAGFLASTYMRGIPWVQVPTTLLAMADASVGGKVGIDLPLGKNLLGAFHQPKAVYADIDCLKTLPRAHLLNGMAEVVKSSLIKDAALFFLLEKKGKEIVKLKGDAIAKTLARSVKVKATVVEKDAHETLGLRKILNYGHTMGHGLETLSNYRLLHGFAIAFGMRAAGRIAVEAGFLKKSDLDRQNRLLKKLGFPSRLPARLAVLLKSKSGRSKFFIILARDKKAKSGRVEMVLLSGIGRVKHSGKEWTVPVGEKFIALGLEEIM